MDNADFGIYHHSTREDSEKLREITKNEFYKIFGLIKKDNVKNVLDAGSGLGFLSYVILEKFHNVIITGIDIYNDNIENNSMEKAIKNLKILNIDKSVRLINANLLKLPSGDNYFDMIVSNLVYHNIDDKINGYKELNRVLKTNGYFIYADLFFNDEDIQIMENSFKNFKKLYTKNIKLNKNVNYNIYLFQKLF